jgi:uncharacterized phiE125 gp8 family phage protein
MISRGFSIIKVTADAVVEPVTLPLLKKHVEIDFSDHDDLLEQLLISAREQVEKFLCVSLVDTSITVRWEELSTEELPYGPVHTIAVTDEYNSAVTGHTIEGLIGSFVKIKANRTSPTIINYTAGYPHPIPRPISLAIMKLATDHFEARTGIDLSSNEGGQLPNNWKATCRSYRRIPWSA